MEMKSEDDVIFCQEDFMVKSFDAFDDTRRNEEFVDFRFSLENLTICGHRLVLAARIPRFREIFCSSEEEITLSEIEPNALESIINFAYSGKIKINAGNVTSLLSASKVLQVTPVYDACWEFLERRFHSDNVLEVRRLAEDHDRSKALEAADNYIKQHFEEFTNSERFFDLPFQQLKDVISRDDVNVSTEGKVFEAVISWVKRCPSERGDLLPELLSCVRMYFLTPRYLIERVSTEKLVRSSFPCRDLVEEAKNYHLLGGERSKFCNLPSQPRCLNPSQDSILPSVASHDIMYCPLPDGNRSRDLLLAACCFRKIIRVQVFDPMNKTWLKLSTSSYPSAATMRAVASVDGVIYIFMTSVVLIFNLSTRQWDYSAFEYDVWRSGSVSYNGKIYFFGGLGSEWDKVRYFDPKQKKLFDECNMTKPISLVGVAVSNPTTGALFTSEVPIYVTGGRYDNNIYNDVERYIPQSKQWTKLSPMLSKRYGHECSDLNGKIYVCGGRGCGMDLINSAEAYDPFTNQWEFIPSTSRPSLVSVTSYGGRLYEHWFVVKSLLKTGHMEIYDPKINKWTFGEGIHTLGEGCCVLLAKSTVTKDIYIKILMDIRSGVD